MCLRRQFVDPPLEALCHVRVGFREIQGVDLRPVVVGEVGACAGPELDNAAVGFAGGETAVWVHLRAAGGFDEAVIGGGKPAMPDVWWVSRHCGSNLGLQQAEERDAAVQDDVLADDHLRLRAAEENHEVGDVFRRDVASGGNVAQQVGAKHVGHGGDA